MIVLMMGVSGSGKTTIGSLLARQTGAVFADADAYHSPANKAKMAAGHPLDDADRQPWLALLNALLLGWYQAGTDGVLACSALKESYRTALAAGMPAHTLHTVWLQGSKQLLIQRLAGRHHEFMNADLLDSQIGTLEAPADAIAILNDRSPASVVAEITRSLKI